MKDKLSIFVGIILAALGASIYFFVGYSILILFLWVSSIIVTASYFYKNSKMTWKNEYKKDLIFSIFLLILFIPVYFFSIHTIPYQVNPDEVAIMTWQKKLTNTSQPDLFALSDYWGIPSFVFIFTGTLGNLLGGVNLLNMRMVHAFFGLLIVPSSYLFFRTLTKRKIAVGAAIILGINHGLVAISRTAMRENLALLGSILALALLIYGLKKKMPLSIFACGVVCGLNWYGYYPGRSTLLIVFLFLLILLLFYSKRSMEFLRINLSSLKLPRILQKRKMRPTTPPRGSQRRGHKYKSKELIGYGTIIFLGFFLVILPLLTAMLKQDEFLEGNIEFQRRASLLHSEGRQVQKEWFNAESVSEGIKINIIRGITTYNNFEEDLSSNYWNPGHGFLDPLTGIFLWIGFLIILSNYVLRKDERNVLILAGFVTYLLVFSFIVNRMPNYPRLLVVLPFVSYLAIIGLECTSGMISKFITKLQKTKITSKFRVKNVFFVLFLITIVFLNLNILSDYIKRGINEGNELGGTARYIEKRNNIEGYAFYLATADHEHRYYFHGYVEDWVSWFGYFVEEDQHSQILSPDEMSNLTFTLPFTVFMTDSLWDQKRDIITRRYPNYTIHNIKPDGSNLAIEVK